MSTISKYVFVTLQEISAWLNEGPNQKEWRTLLDFGADRPIEDWDGSESSLDAAHRIYIAPGSVNIGEAKPASLDLGQLGWIQMDIPKAIGNTLFGIQIACKTDYFNENTGMIVSNPMSRRIFDRFWRRWKRHFTFPMVCRNRITHAEGLYRSIGCSQGAQGWLRKGGILRQVGVKNIEFVLPAE